MLTRVPVITFMTPGLLKTTLAPAANQNPAIFICMLYLCCWNLAALRDEPNGALVNLASLIKNEGIQQINKRLSDPKTACTTETITAISWLSAGVWVCTRIQPSQLPWLIFQVRRRSNGLGRSENARTGLVITCTLWTNMESRRE